MTIFLYNLLLSFVLQFHSYDLCLFQNHYVKLVTKLITNTLQTTMTSRNNGHSGAVLQSKLVPVSSKSGPNSYVIALIMQLLMLLTVLLFDIAVPETITNVVNIWWTKSELLEYYT